MFRFIPAHRTRPPRPQRRSEFERLEHRFVLDAPVAVDDAYTIRKGEAISGGLPSGLPAGAVVWRTEDGGNGHAYLGVSVPATLDWTSARTAAESLGGHLATITSQAEANFINSNVPLRGGWIGGYQDRTAPDFSEPAGGWRWITGELWQYTNWGPGEPNESGSILEDFVNIGNGVVNLPWNDHPDWTGVIPGYFVEFPTSANVLANDTDADGDVLTATLISSAANGTLNFGSDGSFTYTPNSGFIGADTFTYRANDGLLESNVATVTITVREFNAVPSTQGDAYAVDEDASLVVNASTGILANDTVAEQEPLTAAVASPPANGTLALAADGSFAYLPNPNFFGNDTFTYRASDGVNDSPPTLVTITVRPVPDIPVAVADSYRTAQGRPLDRRPSPDTAVTVIEERSVWKYLDNGSDPRTAWREIAFDDSAWRSGPAELGYGDGDEATVVDCSVAPGNECDIANPNKYITTYFRRAFTVDYPSLIMSLSLDLRRDDGAVVYLNGVEVARDNLPSGTITYLTLAANAGSDDGNVFHTFANLNRALLVSGQNVIAVEIHQQSAISSDISFDLRLNAAIIPTSPVSGVLANDFNPDGDVLTATLVSPPNFGTLSFAADGTFLYTPAAGFAGTDSFTYRVRNAAGESNLATATIIVVPTITPESVIPVTTPYLGVINLVLPAPEGGLYFAGSFTGTVDFDPGPGVTAFTSAGDRDTVIALYATDGALLWARQIGGFAWDFARSMAVDRDGNVYVKGDLNSTTASFDGTVVTPDVPSLYFVKLDSSGNFSWIITPQGSQNNRSLAIDDSSEDRNQWSVYTVPLEPADDPGNIPYYSKLSAQTGEIIDTFEYIPFTPNDSYVMEDVFVHDRGLVTTVGYSLYYLDGVGAGGTEITRWDNNFNILWSSIFAGTLQQLKQQVVVDAQGNTYVEAIFNGTVGFTPPNHDNDMTSRGSVFNAYVSALDDAGRFKWAMLLGATETVEGARIALALDPVGRIFATGEFRGVADFGPIRLPSAGDSDAYVAQLDPADGAVVAAWRIGGTARDFTGSIGTDTAGNVFTQLTVRSFLAASPTGGNLTPGEYIVKFRAPETVPGVNGDVNGDGRVDRLDVALLASYIGVSQGASHASGDVSGDGRVSLVDMAIVQQNLNSGSAASPSGNFAASPSALIATAPWPRQTRRRVVTRAHIAAHSMPTLPATRRALSSSSARHSQSEHVLRASPQPTAPIDQAFAETHSWRTSRIPQIRNHRGHKVPRMEIE